MGMTSDKEGGSWALAGNLWTGRVQDNLHRIDGNARALGTVLVTAEATGRGPSVSLGGGSLRGGVKRERARKDKETE